MKFCCGASSPSGYHPPTRYHAPAAANSETRLYLDLELFESYSLTTPTLLLTFPLSLLHSTPHSHTRIFNMAHRLEQLLPELLIELVKYLPRPSDRGNLCLLSKSLYDCVLPILYYTIALDTSSSCVQPDADAGLLRIGNPGIEHVRNFSILATKGVQDCENEARFLRMFLLALPCDTLKHL